MIYLPSQKCTGCGACASICPNHAISMTYDNEGFLRPTITQEKCVECHLCEGICPALKPFTKQDEYKLCLAVKAKDSNLLKSSSSGGVFSILAKLVILKGGCVYGCQWSPDFLTVHHSRATSLEEFSRFKESKYLQSDLRGTFQEVKEDLKKNKYVLFTGTPCQISGLKHFLKREYEHLLTVDLLCHGVPSPKVWQTYLKDLSKRSHFSSLTEVNFRYKEKGWTNSSLLIKGIVKDTFEDIVLVNESGNSNSYMKAFLSDLCLRPSCYVCPVRAGRSHADITIGDFWGIEAYHLFDDVSNGVSAVIINSDRGFLFWEKIIEQCDFSYKRVERNNITDYNKAYYESYLEPPKRSYFMKHLDSTNSFEKLVNKSLGENKFKSYYFRLKRKVRLIVKRILR